MYPDHARTLSSPQSILMSKANFAQQCFWLQAPPDCKFRMSAPFRIRKESNFGKGKHLSALLTKSYNGKELRQPCLNLAYHTVRNIALYIPSRAA